MQRKIIIGDIHGCFDELIELLEKVGLTDEDLLISLGDIVDRGSKSKEVYEYLRNRPNTIILIGNHERKHLNGVLSYAQDIVKVQFGDDYASFLEWLASLGYYYETEEAIIVHAAFEHDVLVKQQKPEVLSGSTAGERFLEKKYGTTLWTDHYRGEKPVIYGHHVVGFTPEIKNNTYGIDTGACHGGWLTAIELPGFKIHQVKSPVDYWVTEQKNWQLPVLASKDWLNMSFDAIKKQLNKLSFVEDGPVKQALDDLNNWVNNLEEQLPVIKVGLDIFTKNLLERCPDTFNSEASKFPFKTFLYKSKANNLALADLQKSLDNPAKINALANELNIKPIASPAFFNF